MSTRSIFRCADCLKRWRKCDFSLKRQPEDQESDVYLEDLNLRLNCNEGLFMFVLIR